MEIVIRQGATKENVASCSQKENDNGELSIASAITHPNKTTQLLLTTKPLIHRTEAGINPLVDAAAYIFSLMGKLKHIKSYKNFDLLQAELAQEIKDYQKTIATYNYNLEYMSEFIPISCYIMCETLDDIISNTHWGNQGKWESHRLVTHFHQTPLSHENLLIILERLVRDSAIYIDMMEFMYICLNLGFKCRYNSSESDYEQLESITNSLYKRIRTHRGDFDKRLSPYSIKPQQYRAIISWKKTPSWLLISMSSILFISLFFVGRYLIDIIFLVFEKISQNGINL